MSVVEKDEDRFAEIEALRPNNFRDDDEEDEASGLSFLDESPAHPAYVIGEVDVHVVSLSSCAPPLSHLTLSFFLA
jgi:hypothetical protein